MPNYGNTERKKKMNRKSTKSDAIQTPVGRASYPALDKPSNKFNENRYKIVLLFEKNTDEVKGLQETLKKLAIEHFGKTGGLTFPLKDGDKDGKNPGYWVLNAHSLNRVPVVDVKKNALDPAEVYGGCWARAIVRFATYEQQGGGITCYLQGVQKIKDDTPFGGGANFDDFEAAEPTKSDMVEDEDVPF